MTRRIELGDVERVETGPVKFVYAGEPDWTGVFIRGDAALCDAAWLKHVLDAAEEFDGVHPASVVVLENLLKALVSCDESGEFGAGILDEGSDDADF